jgi:Putative peptidoglycan binding domain
MKTILAAGAALSALLIANGASAGAPDDYPPNATPGHCYQHILTPQVTETHHERVMDVPEHTATHTIPAVYGEVEKQVVVREGHVEHFLVPPTYRTVTETEVVRPESVHTEVIPAQYDVVTERVLVREAHTEWRREPGPVSDPDMPRWPSDRDIVCLVRIPAAYRLETRHIQRSPERIIRTILPAELRTRTREVIDQPAHDEQRTVGPIYSTVREKVVIQPERTETYTVPATYRDVVKTTITAGHAEWREYPCRKVEHHHRPQPPHDQAPDGERGALDPSAPPGFARHAQALAQDTRGEHGVEASASIARLQAALSQRGYYSGPIDGLFTIPTGNALTRFQRDKDLPLGGFNFATAQALGLQ